MFRRMSPPPAEAHSHQQRRRDFDLRRSMKIGLTFAGVFTLAVVVGWLVWPDGDGNSQAPPATPSDPAITAFYEAEGAAIVNGWEALSPELIRDVADGGTCLPSVEIHAARCTEIPGLMQQHVADLQGLIAEARASAPPPGTVAAGWVASQLAAWDRLLPTVEQLAQVAGIDFADLDGWESARIAFRDSTGPQTEAELQKQAMFALVEPTVLVAGASRTKGGGG